jgi:uncharacterized protein (UPF0248 family)
MEVTPEIFIESDEYHIAERQLLGKMLASHSYGIFPNSNFKIEHELHNNQIEIQISDCTALVRSGSVINIQNKTSFSKELPTDEISECYVVLSVNYDDKIIDESEMHIVSQYFLSFINTDEPVENGIPVLKIYKKTSSWETATNYIPPSIALNSVNLLMNKFIEIKNVINKILHYFNEKDSDYLLSMLLQIELNNVSSQESPETLIRMMKKFCLVFQAYLKTVKKNDPLQSVKKFMDVLYNHHEINAILDLGYASLMDILKILEVEPAPEIEEIKV